jgi:hypothetical protein
MLTPETALADIKRLGFPPIFERIWAGEFKPWGLAYICRPPEHFFEWAGSPPFFPRSKWCVPLWDEDGPTIVFYDKATGEFLEHFCEDEEPTVIGKNYQQFITHFLIGLVQSGTDDTEVTKMAELFEYRHLAEFWRWAYSGQGEGYEAHQESERRFMESIPDEPPPHASKDAGYEEHG